MPCLCFSIQTNSFQSFGKNDCYPFNALWFERQIYFSPSLFLVSKFASLSISAIAFSKSRGPIPWREG